MALSKRKCARKIETVLHNIKLNFHDRPKRNKRTIHYQRNMISLFRYGS